MNRMLKIRRSLSLSQAEMAARLGVTQSSISRYERDELEIDLRTNLALDALEASSPSERDAA